MAPTMDGIIHKYPANNLLWKKDDASTWHKSYFFFRQELGVRGVMSGDVLKDQRDYAKLKRDVLRHAILYKGKIYDYIVDKHYNTLSEWAEANGKTLNDIVYGVNHIHFGQDNHMEFCSLKDMMEQLAPGWKFPPENTQTATIRETDEHEKVIKSMLDAIKIAETQLNHLKTLVKKFN